MAAADGGTTQYEGFGYVVVRLHTMMENLSSNPQRQGKYRTGAHLSYEPLWPYPTGFDFRPNRQHVQISSEQSLNQ